MALGRRLGPGLRLDQGRPGWRRGTRKNPSRGLAPGRTAALEAAVRLRAGPRSPELIGFPRLTGFPELTVTVMMPGSAMGQQ